MATYVDLTGVTDRLRPLFPNNGNIFFVDCDAGVDAAGRGTHALPTKTIQYTIDNYVTYNAGDVLICYASAAGAFDEHLNVDGVEVGPNTYVIGIGYPTISNSHAAATDVFSISGDASKVWGFHINGNHAYRGITCAASYCLIGCDALRNIFENCSPCDVRFDGPTNQGVGNLHIGSSIGYYTTKGPNEIYHDKMEGTLAGGSIGVTAVAGSPNYVHDCDISNYQKAFHNGLGQVDGCATRNAINCTIPVDDLNAPGLNNWEGNYITGISQGVDAQLTVANGTNPVTIATPTVMAKRFKGVSITLNGGYAGGAHGSFKANATAGSFLEAWVEVQTVNGGATWYRATPSTDEYRLVTTDAQDFLTIDNINGIVAFRVRAALSAAPTATVDLDWQVIIDQ